MKQKENRNQKFVYFKTGFDNPFLRQAALQADTIIAGLESAFSGPKSAQYYCSNCVGTSITLEVFPFGDSCKYICVVEAFCCPWTIR